MKKLIFFILLTCTGFLSACEKLIKTDYACTSYYRVQNMLPGKIVVYHEANFSEKGTDTVYPMKSVQIYESVEMCSKNWVPPRYPLPFDSIGIFYNGNNRINKNFKNDSLWQFYNSTYQAMYLLVVDSSFLKKF